MNPQAPGLHTPTQLFLDGAMAVIFSVLLKGLRKPEVQSRRSLTRSMTLKAIKKKKHWASKSLSSSSYSVLSASHEEGLAMQASPSLALKGKQQKVSVTPDLFTSFYLALQPISPAFYENFLAMSRSGGTQTSQFCPKPNISSKLIVDTTLGKLWRQAKAKILFTKQTK